MSGYGTVINGGKQMSKGVGKPINDKLEKFASSHAHSENIASRALKALGQESFSDQHINNINAGKPGSKPTWHSKKDKARLET